MAFHPLAFFFISSLFIPERQALYGGCAIWKDSTQPCCAILWLYVDEKSGC